MIASRTFSSRTGFILGICLAFFSLGFGAEITPVSVHGRLHIKGNRFVDKYDKPVTLHGMSTYNWTSAGTMFYNTTAIERMAKEWKCSAIRCVLLPSNAGSQTNLVDTVVKACIANGMYVIINWHSMGGANASDCGRWMIELAKRYKDTPNVMYEPWNEPVKGEIWPDIKAYHEKVIKDIRSIDSNNIIICGTPMWCQRLDQAAADPITTSTNIAYAFHFYAAWPQHRVDSLGPYVQAALDSGLAIFSTEYGTCEASGGGKMDTAETRKWWKYLDSNGIGCTNWSLSAQGETSAAFNGGTDPRNFSDANLKPSGAFVKAYILSAYELTITGVMPHGFNYFRPDMGERERLSCVDGAAQSMPFTVNGARVIGAANGKQATGVYIFQAPGSGKPRGITIVR